MVDFDLFLRNALRFNLALRALLERHGLSAVVLDRFFSVVPMLELGVLVGTCALGVAGIRRAEGAVANGIGRWAVRALYVASAAFAARLLYWILLHPSRELIALMLRWDYLVFCLLSGCVLAQVPLAIRKWFLALLSIVFVGQYTDRNALVLILAACLTGYAAARWQPQVRPAVAAVVQGVLLAGVFAVLWRVRPYHGRASLFGWGLFSFVMMRHISFVVEAYRGACGSLGNYLCYLLFYPNCIGAMEVYPEFAARNLEGDGHFDYRTGVLKIVRGSLLMWLALQITMTEDGMLVSPTTPLLWQNLLLVFVRGALFSMGLWSAIEGGALFYGFRLRPNFEGVLTAENPSQFWRAWRGTMTNWLIRYVYIPLGGNRRHQTLNIFAAFVVSTVWHCLGIPFLHWETYRWWYFLSVITWGLVNFAGVAAHAWVRHWRSAPERPEPARTIVRGGKIALTMCFGSLTVALLGFSLSHADRFGWFMWTLVGLSP